MRFRRSLKTNFPIGGLGDHELHRRQIALAHDMATRLQYYTHQRQAPHQDESLFTYTLPFRHIHSHARIWHLASAMMAIVREVAIDPQVSYGQIHLGM